ncbi:MAG: hypothetical protein E7158_05180 [Firmicutes bacterium]|nr:hypothetical protein [Bacillota bacterium]
MTQNKELIKEMIELLNKHQDNADDYEPSSNVACNIRDIFSMPIGRLKPMDVYYLSDTLIEILIKYNLISEDFRAVDEGFIDISECSQAEIKYILEHIIMEVNGILDEYGLLD